MENKMGIREKETIKEAIHKTTDIQLFCVKSHQEPQLPLK